MLPVWVLPLLPLLLLASGPIVPFMRAAASVKVNLRHIIPAATETYWQAPLLPAHAKQYPQFQLVPRQLGIENPALISAGLKAGGANTPDLAWLSSMSTGIYAQVGVLADVMGYLNANPKIKSNIYPPLITLSSFQGKVGSLP